MFRISKGSFGKQVNILAGMFNAVLLNILAIIATVRRIDNRMFKGTWERGHTKTAR